MRFIQNKRCNWLKQLLQNCDDININSEQFPDVLSGISGTDPSM